MESGKRHFLKCNDGNNKKKSVVLFHGKNIIKSKSSQSRYYIFFFLSPKSSHFWSHRRSSTSAGGSCVEAAWFRSWGSALVVGRSPFAFSLLLLPHVSMYLTEKIMSKRAFFYNTEH